MVLETDDPRVAYDRAARLQETTAAFRGPQAWLRAYGASWIKHGEELSLSQLAQELGLTKARAQQFEAAAKENRVAEFDEQPPAD